MHTTSIFRQLRINIERAFGVYVHRWAILRAPLVILSGKVGPLVMCICHLRNDCNDEQQIKIEEIEDSNAINIQPKLFMETSSSAKAMKVLSVLITLSALSIS